VRFFQRTPLDAARWVAVDCETSGLDLKRDRLLSVGAVKVTGQRIEVGQAFHSLVKQAAPSASANILVHGIGGDAQVGGRAQGEVVRELESFVAEAMPVGFHAPFDAEVLRRHGFRARHRWLDLAELAPALFTARKAQQLEEWLAEFGIAVQDRHDALGDAFSTAQLLLVLIAEAKRQGAATAEDLRDLTGARRWLR
jgi:DNA polymerase-3 subunit epsilon